MDSSKNIKIIGRIFSSWLVFALLLCSPGNAFLSETGSGEIVSETVSKEVTIEQTTETSEESIQVDVAEEDDTENGDFILLTPEVDNLPAETVREVSEDELSPAEALRQNRDQVEKKKELIQEAIENYKDQVLRRFSGQQAQAQKEMSELRQDLGQYYENLEENMGKIEELEEKLPEIREKIEDLNEFIAMIDEQISLEQLKLELIRKQIESKKQEIFTLMKVIKVTNITLSEEREKFIGYMRMMYDEVNKYSSSAEAEENTVKVLLSDTSFGTHALRRDYFDIYQKKARYVVISLDNVEQEYRDQANELEQKRGELNLLYTKEARQKSYLERHLAHKETLLNQTKGEQVKYQILLAEYRKQQEEVETEIASVQKNIGHIENKIAAFEKLSQSESNRIDNLDLLYTLEDIELDPNAQSFFDIWPVNPSGGITAYFHDPTYPFGVHNAIDVRQAQGSFIYAPAAGYVYKAKDNGMGYSYLILAHRDNVLTVYGHVSEFLVKEGDLVQTGDVLAKSGGMPGSKGAGWMTTGPHLHFEVHKNGTPVDPLQFLPLEFLPEEYVPLKYKEDEAQN